MLERLEALEILSHARPEGSPPMAAQSLAGLTLAISSLTVRRGQDMTEQPVVISVSKPLWAAWSMTSRLRMVRVKPAQVPTGELLEALSLNDAALQERADHVPEVVYGLWMEDRYDHPMPITSSGVVPGDDYYVCGETPEETLGLAEYLRDHAVNAVREELARR
ncbi:hypothetical protein [Micromonospora sp. DT233]|uniref:hypothetical protein n=1 Tax=Micromonospora sp. DT233 TaxID=3393432 RepID=UPI003CF1C8BC